MRKIKSLLAGAVEVDKHGVIKIDDRMLDLVCDFLRSSNNMQMTADDNELTRYDLTKQLITVIGLSQKYAKLARKSDEAKLIATAFNWYLPHLIQNWQNTSTFDEANNSNDGNDKDVNLGPHGDLPF